MNNLLITKTSGSTIPATYVGDNLGLYNTTDFSMKIEPNNSMVELAGSYFLTFQYKGIKVPKDNKEPAQYVNHLFFEQSVGYFYLTAFVNDWIYEEDSGNYFYHANTHTVNFISEQEALEMFPRLIKAGEHPKLPFAGDSNE